MLNKVMRQLKGPDGYGFYYGDNKNGQRINILPPRDLWNGDVMLDGSMAPGKKWKVLIDDASPKEASSIEAALKIAGLES